MARAMKEVGVHRDKIRDAILKIENYHGVMGTYHFTPTGDGLRSVGVVKIEQGKPKLVKSVVVTH